MAYPKITLSIVCRDLAIAPAFLAITLLACQCGQAFGQVFNRTVRIEAVPGEPFGVGRIVVPLTSDLDSERLETHLMAVVEDHGRVLYPAVRYTKPLALFRDVLGLPEDEQAPSQLHVHFLFKGSDPFELKLSIPKPQTYHVEPRVGRVLFDRLMRGWWIRYKAAARRQRQEGDYMPVVETYLTSMLANRLRLPPLPRGNLLADDGKSLSMLLGTEQTRLAMLRDAVEGKSPRNFPLTEAMPSPIQWREAGIPKLKTQIEVEPIARHVPQECFYIRFSRFQNYLWLRRLLEEFGGDLSRMVMLRGTDAQLNRRVENQLGLRESALSRLLGPKVISDVAMIGRDTYLKEGGAIGILFEAKSDLLERELSKQRQQRTRELKEYGAVDEKIQLDGHEVQFASTPDNQLRSFYVISGKYHLVTNCRQIARRFLQCGQGVESLGDSEEFQYARSLIPLGEDNTLFVYLSRSFFQGLLSPRYQIEVPRRLRAVTDLQLSRLARLAASAEGLDSDEMTSQELVEAGFLATPIDRRSDGSRNVMLNEKVADSRRGGFGTFLPIPDTPVDRITREEASHYRRTAQFYQNRWQQMDPVLIGLRRTALDGNTERVQMQARMLPLNREKYGVFTELFGPPTKKRIKPNEQDIVSVQAIVDGGNLAMPTHHLYFALRDAAPNRQYSQRRFLKSLQVLRTAPAYVAAWPKPGFLDTVAVNGEDLGGGYSKLLMGLLRLDARNGYSMLSFDKEILEEVAPLLKTEETDQAAQLHVQIGDIKNSKFGQWADGLDFQRAWETSVGNVHLMHLLTQQLHVEPAEAKTIGEELLNAQLICPLNGDYECHANPDGTKRWVSSAWLDGKQNCRQRYQSPLMSWLRGLELAVTIESDRIVAEGMLDIERDKRDGGLSLPKFRFFGKDASADQIDRN